MSPNERSAEWLRGAVEALEAQSRFGPVSMLEHYLTLLAVAEDREGGENAAEISADRAWIDGAKFGWNCETKTDLHEAIANRQQQIRECSVVERVNAAVQSVQPTPTQPTAAEVIEAAEKAMKRTARLQALTHREDSYEVCYEWCPACQQDAALALCARWKEANGA